MLQDGAIIHSTANCLATMTMVTVTNSVTRLLNLEPALADASMQSNFLIENLEITYNNETLLSFLRVAGNGFLSVNNILF